MPHYALFCIDKPDSSELRKATRDDHLSYVAQTGVVEQAGALLDEEERMIGSLIILDVPDMAAAQHWGGNDPYFMAGLFQSVTLHRWKKVVG